jgi:hypothetical protein
MDGTHSVLMDVLLGLRLGDLHFCKGDPSNLYNIEPATESGRWLRSSGCGRNVFYVYLQDVTTTDGPRARSFH